MADSTQNFLVEWDKAGEHFFESGTDHGVIYQLSGSTYTDGEAWNGLTAVNSNAGGAEANELWADNIKYAVLRSAETYGGTIECYTYPDSFRQNNGEAELVPGIVASGQGRKAFGLSYRTKIGNEQDGLDHGYKIHLVYNATVNPTEKAYQTINDSPDAITMSFEFETTPIGGTGSTTGGDGLAKPTAHLEIKSIDFKTTEEKAFLAALEQMLYGTPEIPSETPGEDPTPAVPAKLPTPAEIVTLYNSLVNTNDVTPGEG